MDAINTIITSSAQETKDVGQRLADSLGQSTKEERKTASIICLYGELGGGKTTFVQGFAKGVHLSTRLLSPTFIIVRRYELSSQFSYLYHMDLYRVNSLADMNGLGIGEIFSDPSAIVLVEWAERLESLLPKKRTDIMFEVISEEKRRITIHHAG